MGRRISGVCSSYAAQEQDAMTLRIFGDPVLFSIGPVPVTETMVTSLGATLLLVAMAMAMRLTVVRRPHHWLAVLALLTVEWLDAIVRDIIGRRHPVVATVSGSLFVFIAGCNVIGQLPGTHPVTASLATTSALATVVFLAVPIAGIRTHGFWGYIQHYVRPNPIFMPLHVLSEVSRTLALSVRLFGNVMSGHLVVALLVALAGFLVPTPMMALDLLIGLLQAYIFTVLSTVYIGAALSSGEDS
jgi:F-type H+-transporting ATPase subunit a